MRDALPDGWLRDQVHGCARAPRRSCSSSRRRKVSEGLRTVGLDAALMIHEEGATVAEAQAYVEKRSLATPDQAQHSVRFVTDPTRPGVRT